MNLNNVILYIYKYVYTFKETYGIIQQHYEIISIFVSSNSISDENTLL
jgi:hypothetical protein